MALPLINECTSCIFLNQFEAVLDGAGKKMFQAMSTPISDVLVGFVIIVLLFHVQIRQFLNIMNSELDQAGFMQEIYSHSGRLAVVAMTIGAYEFWHDYVIGALNLVILTVAKIVMSSLNADVFAGTIISGQASGGDDFNDLFNNSEEKQFSIFVDLMKAVYDASYAPIVMINASIGAADANFLDKILNGAAEIGIFFRTWLVGFCAAVSNTLFMLILVMHRIMTELVVGLGPLVMGLWIFKATKPYAYAAVKMLLATGSSVIAASFLMSLALSVSSKTFEGSEMMKSDGTEYRIDEAKLAEFMFSEKFMAFENAYILMVFLMFFATIIAVTTLLAQKPQLESR